MTVDKCKILLVGSGGVGTIASYSLEYTGKASVTSVIRSDYQTVTEKGFTIDSCDYGYIEAFRPTNVVKSVGEANKFGPFDFIVLATKCLPDITDMTEVVAPAVTQNTALVLVQNGIDIEGPFIDRFPDQVILSGVSFIGSSNKNGFISHEGSDHLKIGFFENKNLSREKQESVCKNFIACYQNEKNECIYDEDVKFSRWRKLVYNASLNPICALTELDVGRLELFGGVDSIIRSTMREIIAVAKSDGVSLPDSVIEFMIRSDDPIYYCPSMLVDVKKGNYMEIEVICGNAVRVANKNGVAIPNLSLIYNLLKLLQMKMKEQKGVVTVPKERPVPTGT